LSQICKIRNVWKLPSPFSRKTLISSSEKREKEREREKERGERERGEREREREREKVRERKRIERERERGRNPDSTGQYRSSHVDCLGEFILNVLSEHENTKESYR
jgi:hypothetical protein